MKEHKTAEPDYDEILKGKIDYYGETRAAYDFAAMEYARQCTSQYKSALEEREREIQKWKDELSESQKRMAKDCGERLTEEAKFANGIIKDKDDVIEEAKNQLDELQSELSTLRAEKSQPIDVEGLREKFVNYDSAEIPFHIPAKYLEKLFAVIEPYLSKGTKQE